MLEKLKIMLCFEDSTQDEKLMLILDSVESRLRLLLGGADPPDEMEHIIIEVAIIRFNRIGSEGLASHNVEGETQSYASANDFAPFMDEMVKKHKCIGEARCIGLFGALEVVKNKETREPMQEYGVPGPVMPWIFAELKKRGFATFGRENFIEICPPLIITKEELEEYLPILDEVLTMVDEKFCD